MAISKAQLQSWVKKGKPFVFGVIGDTSATGLITYRCSECAFSHYSDKLVQAHFQLRHLVAAEEQKP